ncbi:F-box only protein 7 [Larimichthys crocea]|uniref:F-box only protein 7 n=1 Tax=Larimichthys crocea TaxID=215358 RepID=A0A6G0HPG0_LARCR|nr:F-box only protein 7 [Larimichthys crocea]
MKLRVRISRQTSRVELPGAEPSLRELLDHVRDTVLPSHGLSADTHFSLSLNGSEVLTDSGQTLSSCGIVSGDLICVVLAEPANASATHANANQSSTSTSTSTNTPSSSTENQRTEQNQQNQQNQQTADMTSNQPDSSSVAPADSEQTSADPLDSVGPSVSTWEPMLCSEAEDGQAPLSLDLLYHSAQTASPSDAIMVAGHQLMLETGFLPQGSELQPADMPAGWRSSAGLYKLQYTHPLCEHSLAMVLSVCMGPVLVINATLKVNQTVDARWRCRWRSVWRLPPELLLRVLRLLDVCSVLRLSAVCRRFNAATADSTLWRHLYRRDFTDSDPSRPRDTDWKELYKRSHKLRCDLRRVRHRSLPPFPRLPRDIFNPLPVPLHPPLPGIIGGEYDQRPNLPHGLLPRPRYDPIGPPRVRPTGRRPADVRRGFI